MGRRRDQLTGLLRRFAWWASTPGGLIRVFAIGFGVRLLFAVAIPGFEVDMNTFRAWADRLAAHGPGAFYPSDFDKFFVDYPPGYLYVLYIVGKISRFLSGAPPSDFLLKIPPILGDLALAGVSMRLAKRLTPATYRGYPWRGIVVSAILLNPAIIFISAVWGQADVFLGLLIVAALGFLSKPNLRSEMAGMSLLVLAVATKPQALFVVPVVLVVLAFRHLRNDRKTGALRVGGLAGVSAAVGLLITAPFRLGPARTIEFYAHASGTYKYTSVWGFNFWGAVKFWAPDIGEDAFRILGIPAAWLGMAAFAAGTAVLGRMLWRAIRDGENQGRALLFAAAASTCVAFAVLTRIHERYLFLALSALAPLVAYQALRRAFVVLSGLFLANTWFAFAYYRYYYDSGGPESGLIDTFYRFFYGTENDAIQRKVISVWTAGFCLFLAFSGWRWLRDRAGAQVLTHEAPPPAPPREKWQFTLHPVGRRGAVIALVIFGLALATRLPGLATPRGMYFDEVYHARTAGEYLQHREAYEWTHPPLAKELMAISTRYLSGFEVRRGGGIPSGVKVLASDETNLYWAQGGRIFKGALSAKCSVPRRTSFDSGLESVTALAVNGSRVIAGGTGPAGFSIKTFDERHESDSKTLGEAPSDIISVEKSMFVLAGDDLIVYSENRPTQVLADGFGGIALERNRKLVWATAPSSVVAFNEFGEQKHTVTLDATTGAVIAPDGADRILVADTSRDRILSIASESPTPGLADNPELKGISADHFASIPNTGMAWASEGTRIRVIEPRGLAVLGDVRLQGFPAALEGSPRHNVMTAVVPGQPLSCVAGENAFGWRFGSAVFGSAMVALAFLIALRLFGSVSAAIMAALFLAFSGLAFTLSRMAMNDSYLTAFVLGAWFCALSSLYRWGVSGLKSRAASIGWVAGCGVCLGGALASKWPALYALFGIGVLYLWDMIRRGREGTAYLAGNPVLSVVLFAALLVGIPLAIYIASYIPYFGLGHSFSELVSLQGQMYGYHAHLKEGHPFGSSWYQWPVGRKAVFLHLSESGSKKAEIWTLDNMVVALGGLVAIVTLAITSFRRRVSAGLVVLGGALVQYLPWITVGRVTFHYHYLPVVPFLAIALGWSVAVGSKPAKRRKWIMAAMAVATVAFFVATLPMLDAWLVTDGYLTGVKDKLLPWIF